jgi:hypothetical protein
MGVKDFLKAVAPEPSVMAAIRAQAKRNKKSTMTMRQIEREIAAFRRQRKIRESA